MLMMMMLMISILFFFTFLDVTDSIIGFVSESEERSKQYFLSELDKDMKYYEPRLKPKDHRNYPRRIDQFFVNISTEITSIKINEKKLKADIVLTESWYDERLNMSLRRNFELPSDLVLWEPSFDLVDGLKLIDCHQKQVLLAPRSQIISRCRLTVETDCEEENDKYPFSEMFCNITLGNGAHTGEKEMYRCQGCFDVQESTLEDSVYYYEWIMLSKQHQSDDEFKLLQVVDHEYLEDARKRNFNGGYLDQLRDKDRVYMMRLRLKAIRHSFSPFIYNMYLPTIFIVLLAWVSGFVGANNTMTRVVTLIGSSGMLLFIWSIYRPSRVVTFTAWDRWCLAGFLFIIIAAIEEIMREMCAPPPDRNVNNLAENNGELLPTNGAGNGAPARSNVKRRTIRTMKRPTLKDVITRNFGVHFCFMIIYLFSFLVFCIWYWTNL